MKCKLLLIIAMICCWGGVISAQITTGEPQAKKIRTGNRAQAGDFGLYLGATSNMFKAIGDDMTFDTPLPLINLKYMVTNEWEIRLGLEFSKTTTTVKGDTYSGEDESESYSTKTKQIQSKNFFSPGFAYHFSKSNILDVYAGVELPIGWQRDATKGSYDDTSSNISTGGFRIGLGAFIGIQAYLGNLPLALGVEYGISSMFHGRQRTKHVFDDGKTEQTYYTPALDPKIMEEMGISAGDMYDNLKASQGQIGNQFRLTLTYYFK